MSVHRRNIGSKGEELAAQKLLSCGYKIIHRNWRNRLGELDIIAEENDTLVFIEVRTTTTSKFGFGFESINNRKISQVRKVSLAYIKTNKINYDKKIRFDVVSVFIDEISENCEVTHIKNAF